jgi:hypothetical protein
MGVVLYQLIPINLKGAAIQVNGIIPQSGRREVSAFIGFGGLEQPF